MNRSCCESSGIKFVSAKSVANTHKLLRKVSSKISSSSRTEELIIHMQGQFAAGLAIYNKENEIQAVAIGVPQILGTVIGMAVLTTTRTKKVGRLQMVVDLQLAYPEGTNKLAAIGNAVVQLDTSASINRDKQVVVKPNQGNAQIVKRKKIDWESFAGCVKDSCIGWCSFSRTACVICVIACAYGSIVDSD